MILRDKSAITEMFILISLLRGRRKLKDIADDVGITIQGVSEYMKILESQGYVKNGEITLKGFEFLTKAIEEIGDFLEESRRIIMHARTVEAIAGERIENGDDVGLFMEKGYLHAYKRRASSMGIAINSANEGEDLGVKNLRGVLDIKYGKIKIYPLPPIEDGGSRAVDMKRVKKIIDGSKEYKIGVCGVVAHVVLSKLGKVDFEFSSANAAVDAYYRGISSILFVSHEMLPHTIKILSEKGVKYELEKI